MKKMIIVILCALGFALASQGNQYGQDDGFEVWVEDLYENFGVNHVFALNFTVKNNNSTTETIHIEYPLPDDGKPYRFSRTNPSELVEKSVGRKDIYPLYGGFVTLAKDDITGRLSLSITYKQEPGENKFSVVLSHFDFSEMNRSDIGKLIVDGKSNYNPYKKPVVRYYKPHDRLESNKTPVEGDKFLATIIRSDGIKKTRIRPVNATVC